MHQQGRFQQAAGLQDLRHSGSMHFSTCSSSSLQSPSSARDLSIRWRVRMPFPQVTLQSLHSDHGDSKQGMVSRPRASGQRAHRAVLRELLHIPLPGPHAHATGDAAGRPGDPLGHGAGGAVCNTRAGAAAARVPSSPGQESRRNWLSFPHCVFLPLLSKIN